MRTLYSPGAAPSRVLVVREKVPSAAILPVAGSPLSLGMKRTEPPFQRLTIGKQNLARGRVELTGIKAGPTATGYSKEQRQDDRGLLHFAAPINKHLN